MKNEFLDSENAANIISAFGQTVAKIYDHWFRELIYFIAISTFAFPNHSSKYC
jgi:hypothetical protein